MVAVILKWSSSVTDFLNVVLPYFSELQYMKHDKSLWNALILPPWHVQGPLLQETLNGDISMIKMLLKWKDHDNKLM